MSDEFREFLKRVGSGTHTSKNLTRVEAAKATKMMLLQEATSAQIGAFMIAHRIKRPTPEELAGILDAFTELGAKLAVSPDHNHQPVVLGSPYDGRSRTVPVTVITALILATADIPVVMHGGERMPTKYGVPLQTIWQQLGVDFSPFDLNQAQQIYNQAKLGFIYLPQHFPAAHSFVPFRDQIGKRPPFATAELAWCPVAGECHLVAGFVHPPTEERFRSTFKIRQTKNFTLVKGLDGSCDLSRSRTGIIAMSRTDSDSTNSINLDDQPESKDSTQNSFERLFLDPQDYDLSGSDIPFKSEFQAIALIREVIKGQNNALLKSAVLNGGFYLWRFGIAPSLESAFELTRAMLAKGEIKAKLNQLQHLCQRA